MSLLPQWLGLLAMTNTNHSYTQIRGGGGNGSPTPSTWSEEPLESEDSAMEHWAEQDLEHRPVAREAQGLEFGYLDDPPEDLLVAPNLNEARRERQTEESLRTDLLEEARRNMSAMDVLRATAVRQVEGSVEGETAEELQASRPQQTSKSNSRANRGKGKHGGLGHRQEAHRPAVSLGSSGLIQSQTSLRGALHQGTQSRDLQTQALQQSKVPSSSGSVAGDNKWQRAQRRREMIYGRNWRDQRTLGAQSPNTEGLPSDSGLARDVPDAYDSTSAASTPQKPYRAVLAQGMYGTMHANTPSSVGRDAGVPGHLPQPGPAPQVLPRNRSDPPPRPWTPPPGPAAPPRIPNPVNEAEREHRAIDVSAIAQREWMWEINRRPIDVEMMNQIRKERDLLARIAMKQFNIGPFQWPSWLKEHEKCLEQEALESAAVRLP